MLRADNCASGSIINAHIYDNCASGSNAHRKQMVLIVNVNICIHSAESVLLTNWNDIPRLPTQSTSILIFFPM